LKQEEDWDPNYLIKKCFKIEAETEISKAIIEINETKNYLLKFLWDLKKNNELAWNYFPNYGVLKGF